MRTISLAALLALAMAALSAPNATAAAPRLLVVDDDRAQCGEADYSSIQRAVDAAVAGDIVRVCPGLYLEQVTVDKPLTIRAETDAAQTLDCFAPTRPASDPNVHAIVAVSGNAAAGAVLFHLQADNIELQGFVLAGPGQSSASASLAVVTDAAHSGYQIHANVLWGHRTGIRFASNGGLRSSFHHNCLRENGWGLVNEWRHLINARVHDNDSFQIRDFAFEQTPFCPEIPPPNTPCSNPSIGMEDVTFEHNTSIQVGAGYRLSWSSDTAVLENTVRSFWPNRSLVGMRLAGANHDLRIVGNDIQASLTGIVSGSFLPSNTDVLIQGNSITAAPGLTATGAGIGMGVGALLDSRILDNTVTGLQGLGIALLSGNTDNLVRGNSVTHNGGDGISAAAGATGNTFELNVMHDNAGVDARDVAGPDGLPVNTWRFNECGTDIPEGTICGVE